MNDLSDEARRLLEVGRQTVLLSPDRRSALRSRVIARAAAGGLVGAATATAATAPATAAAVGGGKALVVKLALLIGVTAGGGAGALVVWRNAQPSSPPAPAEVMPRAPAAIAQQDTREPAETSRLEARDAVDEAAPAVPPPRRRTSSPAKRKGARTPAVEITSEDPAGAWRGGVAALSAARAALDRGHADEALRLLDEVGATAGRGPLAPELAAARVLVLCRLGRAAEAEAARHLFLTRHSGSPLAARVRAGCPAGDETP